jgi:NADH-quinone oxidoreductase chain G
MVSVTVDNIKVNISSESTVLEACNFAGIIVPRFCFHKKLSIAGNCRMCIVEIEKFPKPVSSCTLKVSNGMRIFTKTPLVRKAQETVLEFLLINHPLDCPICDQGGECDLQDQLNFFGSDSSRFFKMKRGVSDKNCGPFVKTIMTRCIHCTRCVRFLSEIGGDNSFGMLGRSSNSEIGLYISDNLKSEFSGNVIDLCPVGALTSKPYSFRGRSWELINYRTLDILDSLNSDILVSLKGSEVLRILPCFTIFNAAEWISDKTRFFYDSFDFFRIKKCWLKETNSFIDWSTSLDRTRSLLTECSNKRKNLGIFLGSLSDLETILLSKHLVNKLGSSDIYSDINCRASGNLDSRSDYSFTSIDSLKKSDLCIVIGSDLRSECPTLNLVIKTQVRDGLLSFGYIGPSMDLSYKSKHLGLGVDSVVSLMKGQHPFSARLKQAKNPYIILGEKFNSGNISQILYKVVNLQSLPNLKTSNISMLRTKSSSVSFSEFGINSLKTKKIFDTLLLFGVEDLKPYRLLNPNSFIIYIGSHYSVYNLELADLILPASIFIEKDFKVINLENIIKESKSLRQISGDTRPEWFLLLVILSFFSSDFNTSQLKKKVIFNSLFLNDYPFIVKKNFKLAEFTMSQAGNSIFKPEIFSRSVFNFYEDNSMLRSSKNFKFCSDNLKQSKFKKKNVA